jgi:hypothetical protein
MVTGIAGKLSKQSSERMNEEGCPDGQPNLLPYAHVLPLTPFLR